MITNESNPTQFPLDKYLPLSPTTGFVFSKLPPIIYNDLKPLVNEIQNDFSLAKEYNSTLAGEIKHEYEFILPNSVTNFIKEKTNIISESSPILDQISPLFEPTYSNGNKQHINQEELIFTYDGSAWVNFQQKHEYNPPHCHSGVFSFVIWYQIPYFIKDELPYNSGDKRNNKFYSANGDFNFLHTNGSTVLNQSLYIDKSKEGYMAIFPSSLYHYVNPFYSSDDYRITISGNIHLLKQCN